MGQWLGAHSLEGKLVRLQSELLPTSTSAADIQGDRLFSTVQQTLQAAIAKLPVAPMSAQEARVLLQAYYQPAFKELRSFLGDEAPIPVDQIACHLMIQEQVKVEKEQVSKPDQMPSRQASQKWINKIKQLKYLKHLTIQEQVEVEIKQEENQLSSRQARLQWVQRPIDLGELFKKRRIKTDEPEKEIHRMLLIGDAGTGKSDLTRKLAYEWSQGKWGQEFEAVYVVPVRNRQKDKYDNKYYRTEETLPTAIIDNCFALPDNSEKAYKRLWEHIAEELKKPTTLLILDGLDEQGGMSQKILEQAKSGNHKRLLTSRPYGIGSDRGKADLEVEHMGLNDEQTKSYVTDKFGDTALGESLWSYIEESETIKEIARVPVNLEILCALWRDKGSGVREALAQGSLPGLYSKFTIWLWKRYAGKRNPSAATRDSLVQTLGEIALNAFKAGQIQISPYFINNYVETEEEEAVLRDSGLLEYVRGSSETQSAFYQFPHLTFQEYFAGCWLAHQFLKDGDEREQVKDFLTDQKYNASYGRTLSFLSG